MLHPAANKCYLAAALAFCFFSGALAGAAPLPPFGTRLIPPEELRQALLLGEGEPEKSWSAGALQVSREQLRATVAEAQKFLVTRSEQLWRRAQVMSHLQYDVVFVGLGPNAVAAYTGFREEFTKRHGRAPRALIVGREFAGSFHDDAEFVLNTAYAAALRRDPGREQVTYGFSPHRGGFAVDPLEVSFAASVFSDHHAGAAIPYEQVSAANGVNSRSGPGALLNQAHVVESAEAAGDVYALQQRNGAAFREGIWKGLSVFLQPFLSTLPDVDVFFVPNRAMGDSLALELARLDADVIGGVGFALESPADGGGPKRLRLTRGAGSVRVEAGALALFTGPGTDKLPFPAGTPGHELFTRELAKGWRGKVITGETALQTLRDPALRPLFEASLRGKQVLFLGNGDSGLTAMEGLLDLRPESHASPRYEGRIAPEIAGSLRERFIVSRFSGPLLDELLENKPRIGRDGKPTLSLSPLQGDRYRRLLTWLKEPTRKAHLVDEYMSEAELGANGRVRLKGPSGAVYEPDLVVLCVGKNDGLNELLGSAAPLLRPVRGQVLDFFSSLSGPTLDRAAAREPILDAQTSAQAPELNIGLEIPGARVYAGGFVTPMLAAVKQDVDAGLIPSFGPRAELKVANPAGLPNNMPRAHALGRRLAELL